MAYVRVRKSYPNLNDPSSLAFKNFASLNFNFNKMAISTTRSPVSASNLSGNKSTNQSIAPLPPEAPAIVFQANRPKLDQDATAVHNPHITKQAKEKCNRKKYGRQSCDGYARTSYQPVDDNGCRGGPPMESGGPGIKPNGDFNRNGRRQTDKGDEKHPAGDRRDEENGGDGDGGMGDDRDNAPADYDAENYWTVPAVQFTKFPELPLELRRMIWGLMLPEPQVVKITGDGYFDLSKKNNLSSQAWVHRPRAQYRVPYMLSICKEARLEVIVHHPPRFQSILGGKPIYFNPDQDVLYFEDTDALIHFYGGSVPNHREWAKSNGYRFNMEDLHLVVRQVAIDNVSELEGMIGGILNQMRGLSQVLINDDHLPVAGDQTILKLTQGVQVLTLGWEKYTYDRPAYPGVDFKFVPDAEFARTINGWDGRIFHKEDLPVVVEDADDDGFNVLGPITADVVATPADAQWPPQPAEQGIAPNPAASAARHLNSRSVIPKKA